MTQDQNKTQADANDATENETTESSKSSQASASTSPLDDAVEANIVSETEEISPIDALQKKHDDLNEKLLRTMADYQNFARRARQDIQLTKELQTMDIAKALLPVLDHFDRALEMQTPEESSTAFANGIQMVRDELIKALEQFGVTKIATSKGDEFNPNYHEALMHQVADDVTEGCVAFQIQPGYLLGEKTIRPAQVAIAQASDA